jgi:hypothetical protein
MMIRWPMQRSGTRGGVAAERGAMLRVVRFLLLARRTFLARGRAARFCYRFAAMRACKTERRKFPPNVFSKFGRAHTLNFPVAWRAQLFFQGINFAANPFQVTTHCRASPGA